MKKLKIILQLVLAFAMAYAAYVGIYKPYQDSARAIVRQKVVPVLTQSKEPDLKDGELKIALLDVGHGDAILLQTKKKNILIDAGLKKNRKMVEAGLTKNGVKEIDTIIITHHHKDHMENVLSFAGKYKVRRIYDNGYANPNYQQSLDLRALLEKGNYHNRVLVSGESVYLDKHYSLEILAPGPFLDKKLYRKFNNTSVVAKLHYGNFSMMFTGDAENGAEVAIAEKYGDKLKADVLKVAHHGSKTSSNWNFVSKVRPKYALISCGPYEELNHPSKQVVGRLEHLEAKVLTTHNNGQLTVITDGNSFRVETEK